jgi:hypothetical protein
MFPAAHGGLHTLTEILPDFAQSKDHHDGAMLDTFVVPEY